MLNYLKVGCFCHQRQRYDTEKTSGHVQFEVRDNKRDIEKEIHERKKI